MTRLFDSDHLPLDALVLDALRESEVEREINNERDRNREAVVLRRLWTAVALAESVAVCDALLAGVSVKATRLDPRWKRALKLKGDVVLDEALALRVNAHGPLEASGGR